LVSRLLRRAPWNPRQARWMLLVSFGLVLADVAVKAVLAPHWRVLLAGSLGN
jgi:hypothetical protein